MFFLDNFLPPFTKNTYTILPYTQHKEITNNYFIHLLLTIIISLTVLKIPSAIDLFPYPS